MKADTLLRSIKATVEGQAVMPAGVATALAAGARSSTGPQPLSAEEHTWLRRLAAGYTVARLAGEAGYSERAMFRPLRSLYRKMGVHTRVQTIVRAQERGWLDPNSPIA